MNICIFIDSPLDAPGGMVQSALNQKKVLEAHGHRVFLVCLGRQPSDDPTILELREYVAFINDDVNFAFLLANPLTRRRVKAFLVRHEIEVVHVQSDMTTAALGVRIAKELGIPSLFTVHNFFWPATGPFKNLSSYTIQFLVYVYLGKWLTLSSFGNNRLEKTIRAMTEYMCATVDHVISPSQHLAVKLKECGVQTPISVIPNPYVTQAALTRPKLLTDQPAHFVWLGRCAPEKRLCEFIDAVAFASAQTEATFKVTIIGNGPELAAAQHKASTLPFVHFTQRIPNDEVIAYLDEASCLVLTSYRFDNQPVVIAEALSRYRGVIYCDDLLKEGVEDVGLLARSPTAEDIAAAMLTVIHDPTIAKGLSHKAKQAADDFSGDHYEAAFVRTVRLVPKSGVL